MAQKKDDFPEFDPEEYPEYDYDENDFDMMGGSFDTSSFWQEPDFLLADIVHMLVNVAELEIGVTLFVKGMTLTGVLTSEKEYLRDLTNTFRKRIHLKNKKMSKQEREEFNAMFDFTRLSETKVAQELDDEGVDMPSGMSSIRFLHLKNPMLLGTEGVMDFAQGDTPFIRLRLTLIDGWMLGQVVTPDMFRDNDVPDVLH
jgi:hypothetical protein